VDALSLEMKRKIQYYHEFGSYNAGTVLVTPVHPDSRDEIQLSLRIRGVRDYDFESIVVLVSGKPCSSSSALTKGKQVQCVYKGICRFGPGLAGVHTLSILEGGEIILHHSPSATLKDVASHHFHMQQPGSSRTADGLPPQINLPVHTLLLTRDSDAAENLQNCSKEVVAEYMTYLVRRLPEPQPPRTPPEEEQDGDRDRDEPEDSLLYISPEHSPHPSVLNDTGFSTMLNKYAKFGTTPLGELQMKLGDAGSAAGAAAGHRWSGTKDSDDTSVASGATASTRSRLQDALHGGAPTAAAIASGNSVSATGPATAGDRALGIADRLMRGIRGTASGVSSNVSVASENQPQFGGGNMHNDSLSLALGYSGTGTVASVLSVDSLDRDRFHSDGRPRTSSTHSYAHGTGTASSGASVASQGVRGMGDSLDRDLFHSDGRPRRSSLRPSTSSGGASVASVTSVESEVGRDKRHRSGSHEVGDSKAGRPPSSGASVSSTASSGRKAPSSTPSYMQATASVGMTTAAQRRSTVSATSSTTATKKVVKK